MNCLFCKILWGEIKTDFIYEDEEVVAFNDIRPEAPVHILIIPKKHVERIQDLKDVELPMVGRLIGAAKKIAKIKKIDEKGYRVVINCDRDAGQAVPHIHLHLLGGRKFGWPPG